MEKKLPVQLLNYDSLFSLSLFKITPSLQSVVNHTRFESFVVIKQLNKWLFLLFVPWLVIKIFGIFFKIRIIELHLLGYPQKIVIIKQLKLIITNRWNSIICILKTKHSINMQIKVRLTILKKRIFFFCWSVIYDLSITI